MPRGSLQIGLPCLEKYASSLVRTPDASSWLSRPSSINSRTACGSTLMPTPSGFSSETLSNTLAGTPIWCRLSARVSPPMPPPAMRTVMTCLAIQGLDDMTGGRGQLRTAAGHHLVAGSRLRQCSLEGETPRSNFGPAFESCAPRLTSEVIDLPTYRQFRLSCDLMI